MTEEDFDELYRPADAVRVASVNDSGCILIFYTPSDGSGSMYEALRGHFDEHGTATVVGLDVGREGGDMTAHWLRDSETGEVWSGTLFEGEIGTYTNARIVKSCTEPIDFTPPPKKAPKPWLRAKKGRAAW